MALKRISKIAAVAMAALMVSEAGLTSFVPLTAEAKEKEVTVVEEAVNAAGSSDNFTWDNATVYFVITDRFYNGDETNDHSYGRSAKSVDDVSATKDTTNKEDAKTTFQEVAGSYAGSGEQGAASYKTNPGTFHGGDLAGLTDKLNEGYFDDLGVNAIWITAPYEQVHGAMCGNGFKHYAYHGYYALDYTEVDANMGTAEELETFIDTAHEHGIRVIFDIVMNHSGYPDGYTIAEYYGANSGLLSSNWQQIYFNTKESDLWWDMDYVTQNDRSGDNYGITQYGDAWNSSYFTTAWQRMVANRYGSGYTAQEGTGLELCSTGLPDFRTESSNKVSIPDILQKKWTKEGRYDAKVAETKTMLNNCGYGDEATIRQYLVAWLSNWVREYGVDGFRCDTAKHVEMDSWNELKTQCKKALTEWRSANPDKAGADWTDDFWMTGEVYDYAAGSSLQYEGTNYSTAFDSLINFGFKGNESKTGSSLESLYSSYAGDLNSSPNNVLSYISSHDKGLGARSANAGTALLLCPGAVQIYYGDETGRTATNSGTTFVNDEQGSRSEMNWNCIDTNIQSNWQKVGQFRRNHASVGAGQHNQLSTSPYTFSRTYRLGQDDEDKVVVSLPGSAGTYDVSVGNIFADGESVTDAYTGEAYTVSGGKVSVTCDSNGVILLEKTGEIKPSVGADITGGKYTGTTYSSETIDVKLNANKVKNAVYSVNDGAEIPYNTGDVITLGGGAAYEEKTVLVLKGESEEDGSEVSKVLNFTKCSEPSVSDGAAIKVSKSEFSAAPYCYAYDSAEKELNGAWPGAKMTDDGDYWSFTPDGADSFIMILSDDNGWRSAEDQQPGLTINGAQLYTKSTGSLTELSVGEKAKVTVKYVDEAGNDLLGGLDVYRVGAVGDSYTTSARIIKGYTIKETPLNAAGKFTADEITVTYVYSGGVTPTDPPLPTVTSEPTDTPNPTDTPEPTDTPNPTDISEPTDTPEPTDSPEPTNPSEVTDVPEPTTVPEDFALDGFTAVKTQDGIRLIANTSGGSGNVRYMFSYEKDGREILIVNFQSENQYIWTPPAAGTYKLNVYAINCGTILDKTVETYTVR